MFPLDTELHFEPLVLELNHVFLLIKELGQLHIVEDVSEDRFALVIWNADDFKFDQFGAVESYHELFVEISQFGQRHWFRDELLTRVVYRVEYLHKASLSAVLLKWDLR